MTLAEALALEARHGAGAGRRPPLGLRPRYVVAEQRTEEIVSAMARYAAAHEPIPLEWVEELRELAEWQQRHRPSYVSESDAY